MVYKPRPIISLYKYYLSRFVQNSSLHLHKGYGQYACIIFSFHIIHRYSEEKTLEWLQKKVRRVADALGKSGMNLGNPDEERKQNEEIHYAYGMISDYIEPSLAALLKTKMNIVDRVEKRKSVGGKQPSAKKSKAEATEDYSLPLHQIQEPVKKNLNRAQKALQKVDKKGMKSISSFFKAKPKAK